MMKTAHDAPLKQGPKGIIGWQYAPNPAHIPLVDVRHFDEDSLSSSIHDNRNDRQ